MKKHGYSISGPGVYLGLETPATLTRRFVNKSPQVFGIVDASKGT